jgi:hypothetical protein
LAPDKYQNFDGRDKSQVKMRLDADREDVDAELCVWKANAWMKKR